jgi:predicted lipoprotein with Yx(FWY)xxD motif
MGRGRRAIGVTTGLLALVALATAACAQQAHNTAGGAGAGQVAATANPPGPGVAPSSAAPVVEPVGITTNKLVATTIPKMGKVVTDAKGWALYRFDKDTANPSKSNCTGTCAQVWPPMLTDGNPVLDGVDPAKVGVITRDDGGRQLTLGGWPLYRYVGDPKPGAWKGQGVSHTWWVSDPTGKKNLTCVPTGTPTPVAPPSASQAAADNGYGNGGTY